MATVAADLAVQDARPASGKLTLIPLIALVVGSMIGGGVFNLPGDMSRGASPGAIIIGWLVTGIGMLMLAFVYQSLAVRKPELNAGAYAYAKAGFGSGTRQMLVVTALGGNALLKRKEAMTAENQRRNVRIACEALAPIAKDNQLVIGHGNGPQVGLLSLQQTAYAKVDPYPFDVLGAETEGMIGYMIEQELGNLLPFERPFATLLTMIEVDPEDPAFKDPTKFIGPVYDKADADRMAGEKVWTFKQDGDKWRRVVPSPSHTHLRAAAN